MIEFIGWCVVVSFCFGTGLFGLLISFIIGFFYPLMWIVTAIQVVIIFFWLFYIINIKQTHKSVRSTLYYLIR